MTEDTNNNIIINPRALILGGAGFIGCHLANSLLQDSYYVDIIDDFSTGSLKNLEPLAEVYPRLTFFKGDICDPERFKSMIFRDYREIYNLACPASPVAYQADPLKTIATCTAGVFNSLEFAKAQGARYFLASTSEVYGDPLVHPQNESYWGNVNCYGPRSCYDEGKRIAETICREYSSDVDVRIGRIFNTYGPHMQINDGRIISNFITQALTDSDITVYGDGMQTRSFCFVNDMVHMIRRLMYSPEDTPVNIGNPDEHPVREIAEIILTLIPESKSKLVFKDLPVDDPKQRRPDIFKASMLDVIINGEQKISLFSGLTSTIGYFRRVLDKS